MRKTLVTALALLSCVGMLACGGDSSSLKDSLKEPTKKPSSSSVSNNGDNSNNGNKTENSENFWDSYGSETEESKSNPLFSFRVTMDGENCQFPCWYFDLMDTRMYLWICNEFKDEIVQPGEVLLLGEGYSQSILVYNHTTEPQEAMYCIAVGGHCTKDYFTFTDLTGTSIDTILAENLKVMSATKADIEAVCGTPTKVGTEGSYDVLTYEAGENKYVALYLENDVLCEFEICNVDKPANEPTMSPDALYSFAFSVNGENFQFPLTCEELVQRGWDPGFDIYTEQVDFHEGVSIVWKKDDTYFVTDVLKEDEGEGEFGLVTDGTICTVRIGNENWNSYENVPKLNERKTDFRLSGDIVLFDATCNDILKAYGGPTKERHGDGEHKSFTYNLEDRMKLRDDCARGFVQLVFDEETEWFLTYIEIVAIPSWWQSGAVEAK